MLSRQRIQDLRAALAAGTPGLWHEGKGYGGIVSNVRHPRAPEPSEGEIEAYGGHLIGESMGPDDRRLVCMLHNDATALLDAAEAVLTGVPDQEPF